MSFSNSFFYPLFQKIFWRNSKLNWILYSDGTCIYTWKIPKIPPTTLHYFLANASTIIFKVWEHSANYIPMHHVNNIIQIEYTDRPFISWSFCASTWSNATKERKKVAMSWESARRLQLLDRYETWFLYDEYMSIARFSLV